MNSRRRSRWLGGGLFLAFGFVAIAACEDSSGGGGPGLTFDGGSIPIIEGGPGPGDATIAIDPSLGLPPGANVDLGLADCGGSITKTVDFANVGGKALDVALATSAPFTITPATLNVAPGAKGTVTLSATIPASSTAGTPLTGTIVLTTNDPKNPKVTVPVTVTPAGATLAFAQVQANADFGTQKLGVKATDITLGLKNTGNKAATFGFGAPSDTQFTIATTPASPVALDPNASVSAAISFTANKLTLSNTSSNIAVTGAVCGTSVTKIDMAGQGAVGALTGFPSSTIDFGASACGGAKAGNKSFVLANSGATDVTITNVTVGPKGYSTSAAANAKIDKNGGALTVTVTPPAIPFPSPVPGDYADTITITTDVPNDPPHVINVNITASGAILAFDTTATPNFGAFGPVPVNSTASQAFLVKNTGNAAANVTATATGATFAVSNGAPLNVPAGGTSTPLDATFHPTVVGPQSGSLSVSATGLCQPLPSPKSLSGQGAVGGIAVSDGSLSFSANCGSVAAPKTFTVTNTGTVPMTWTGKLNAPNGWYNLSPLTATVQPNTVSTITISPKAIPPFPSSIAPSTYVDFVTIKTDIPGDVDHKIFLLETPVGAVLSFNTPTLGFGTIPVDTSSTLPLSIRNDGNLGPAVAVTVSSNNNKFIVNAPSGTVDPDSAFATSVTFQAGSTAGSFTGAISVSATALCAPLPNPVNATGKAGLANVQISPAGDTISFGTNGLTPCGGTASPKDLQFTNPPPPNGAPAINYSINTPVLGKGGASPFSVSVLGGSGPGQNVVLQNNGNAVTVRITPNAIPANVAAVPNTAGFSDTLTITTDAPQDTPHVFQLTQGARGVILDPISTTNWNFGAVINGGLKFFTQSLHNAGNEDVQVSMTGLAANGVFAFASVTATASSNVEIAASFQPTDDHSTFTANGSLSFPAGTTWCQSPPPTYNIALTGKGTDGSLYSVDGTLNFPPVDCGGPANAPQTVTINNNSAATIDFNTSLQDGTWYSQSPATGTILAGESATVTVTPTQILSGPNTYSGSSYTDQLSVSLLNHGSGASLGNYTVSITQTAVGGDIDNWGQNDGTASDEFEMCSLSYAGFNKNGYYDDIATYGFHNNGNGAFKVDTSSFVPNDGWSAPQTTVNPNLVNGNYTFHVQRYSGTSPPNTCGGEYSVGTLKLTGVCRNPLDSLNYTVLRYLNNCDYPTLPRIPPGFCNIIQ